ncbi:RluA family pseudouridine synthase [bacterium (Candidatus Howlettbacteria) CG_4_10_14_0_8_um_filter_40_9]|nr:MAG: RluA family pseudouridine synthase [bacterium (Candidatus Howlettbacteria) CG_4_10_14_0_8_um_filter_40_9]
MRFIVSKGKVRIDKFLSSKILDKSRSFLQKIIREGKVHVGGLVVGQGYVVKSKDVISIDLKDEGASILKKENLKLRIIFEDKDIIVLEKPLGIAVHPAEGKNSGTLVNALLDKLDIEIKNKRPGIVHRLDKDTTGLLVIAKNEKSLVNLQKQFQDREVEKRYLVLVYGHVYPKHGEINIPIGKGQDKTKRKPAEEGKGSVTKFEVIEYIKHDGAEYTLAEASLITGRTHQIRVHFKSIGFPVVGDKDYSLKKYMALDEKLGLDRQFLHAYKLGFHHPKTGKWVGFVSDLPQDLNDVLKYLKS